MVSVIVAPSYLCLVVFEEMMLRIVIGDHKREYEEVVCVVTSACSTKLIAFLLFFR